MFIEKVYKKFLEKVYLKKVYRLCKSPYGSTPPIHIVHHLLRRKLVQN